MQQANLSDRNAYCRFMLGTSMTAFGIAKVSRNPDCTKGKLMIAIGAMKMAEGVFKYCPIKSDAEHQYAKCDVILLCKVCSAVKVLCHPKKLAN